MGGQGAVHQLLLQLELLPVVVVLHEVLELVASGLQVLVLLVGEFNGLLV